MRLETQFASLGGRPIAPQTHVTTATRFTRKPLTAEFLRFIGVKTGPGDTIEAKFSTGRTILQVPHSKLLATISTASGNWLRLGSFDLKIGFPRPFNGFPLASAHPALTRLNKHFKLLFTAHRPEPFCAQ
jgi:hypothetical protein